MVHAYRATETRGKSGIKLNLALLAATLLTVLAALVGSANKAFAEELDQEAIAPSVTYEAHVQDIGWMGAVADGETAGTTGRALTTTRPPGLRKASWRTASAGSKAMMRSAVPRAMSGEAIPSPTRTWLKTLPPRCAMPMVSAVFTGRPRSMAAAAKSFDARTVP